MLEVLRRTGAGCVLMHMRGTPQTMQQFTEYRDLVGEVRDFFVQQLELVRLAGVDPATVVLDPGIGFSKTATQNLVLIASLGVFRALGRPLLAGPSRKSFIGALLSGAAPAERLWGTAAAVACCILQGADIVRVHDVSEMRQVAAVATAIRQARDGVAPQA
jgi:dihydropteroate synthase